MGGYTNKGYQRRYVEDLELFEISILDNRKSPAYAGTSIEMRDDKESVSECRSYYRKLRYVNKYKNMVNYRNYEKEIKRLNNN
ncbi:hypothetical protein SAMN04487886_104916 [Clostridium sp. DSM 8431]|uniref:hypothetical protein n=1 Tax=Clostridium sp. DSM 8431 TaxID=1761781 RepID=UPI0008E3A329|nr:hypothetical protein [Clostridium sp. DSM 8431]SFU53123.1 hypothetical protein SAMN04487886_104916 [Clostridium sp. DSM 8431]